MRGTNPAHIAHPVTVCLPDIHIIPIDLFAKVPADRNMAAHRDVLDIIRCELRGQLSCPQGQTDGSPYLTDPCEAFQHPPLALLLVRPFGVIVPFLIGDYRTHPVSDFVGIFAGYSVSDRSYLL